MTSTDSALEASRRFHTENADWIVADYSALLSLDNVTGDLAALNANAAELVARFTARGGEVEAVSLPGIAPVIVGRLPAAEPRRTLGVYVHYDGQPVNRAAWDTDPFDPVVRDGRIYARGAADDKAPVRALQGWRYEIFGSDALALKHGKLAIGVKRNKTRVIAVK